MEIRLNPALEKFVNDQVACGHFQSADDAVNAIVAREQIEQQVTAGDIDAEGLATLDEELSQFEHGEHLPWSLARIEIFKKYLAE